MTVLPLRARVMAAFLSGVAAHVLDVLGGHPADLDDRPAELALALGPLGAVEVFLAGLRPLQLAVGGDAEALLGGLVRLHLGHGRFPKFNRPASSASGRSCVRSLALAAGRDPRPS